jgi:hypothetical protein
VKHIWLVNVRWQWWGPEDSGSWESKELLIASPDPSLLSLQQQVVILLPKVDLKFDSVQYLGALANEMNTP